MSSEKIILKLHNLKNNMQNVSPHSDELRSCMDELWNTVSTARDEMLVKEVMQHHDYDMLSRFFAPKWRSHIAVLEKQQSVTEISNSSVLLLEKYDEEGLKQELDPINNLIGTQTFVMVGSGPFPETLIRARVGKGTDFRGVGIDRCEESLELAKNVIKSKGFQNEITFVRAEGSQFSYENAGVVLLANGLEGKQTILKRVMSTMPKNGTILVRSPIRLGHLFYEDLIRDGIPSGLRMTKWVEPSSLSRTFILQLEH